MVSQLVSPQLVDERVPLKWTLVGWTTTRLGGKRMPVDEMGYLSGDGWAVGEGWVCPEEVVQGKLGRDPPS